MEGMYSVGDFSTRLDTYYERMVY